MGASSSVGNTWLLALILIASKPQAASISADELRRIIGEAKRERLLKAQQINPNDLGSLLDEFKTDRRAPPSPKARQTDKGTAHAAERANAQAAPSPKPAASSARAHTAKRQAKNRAPHIYKPPPRRMQGKARTMVFAAENTEKRDFGVRIGAWLNGRLSRDFDSAERGWITIVLTRRARGRQRDLPMGTLLFASSRANFRTQRVELEVRKGLLPNGEEFELSGLIFDSAQRAGLSGERQHQSEGTRRVRSSIFQTGVQLLPKNSALSPPLIEALDSVAAPSEDENRRRAGLNVTAQPVFVQIQKSF